MRKVSNEKTGRIFGIVTRAAAGAMAALVAGTALVAVPYNVLADEVIMEWREENGVKYWYENGVRQGVKYREDGSIDASYRGKEIYDPSSNAWYWLDCVQNGAVAKDKDVYQESQADDAGNIGKWVRYDAAGHMVKGWSEKDGNRYYFDPVYGTMAKGDTDIDGIHYYFNKDTGILESGGQTDDDGRSFNEDGWHKVDGVNTGTRTVCVRALSIEKTEVLTLPTVERKSMTLQATHGTGSIVCRTELSQRTRTYIRSRRLTMPEI